MLEDVALADWPEAGWKFGFQRILNETRKVGQEVQTRQVFDFIDRRKVACRPGAPRDVLVEDDGLHPNVEAFLGDNDLIELSRQIDVGAAQRLMIGTRDAADDDPDLAPTGGPELGDAMFDVTPDAAVERGALRRDVAHQEGGALLGLAEA